MAEEKMWEGIPRREVPWYPTVDEELCIGCEACIEHCPAGVFEWDDERDVPLVVNRYDCIVYCKGCANACPEDAISFPEKSEVVELVKRLRVEYASG